jgi:hypothetical protein
MVPRSSSSQSALESRGKGGSSAAKPTSRDDIPDDPQLFALVMPIVRSAFQLRARVRSSPASIISLLSRACAERNCSGRPEPRLLNSHSIQGHKLQPSTQKVKRAGLLYHSVRWFYDRLAFLVWDVTRLVRPEHRGQCAGYFVQVALPLVCNVQCDRYAQPGCERYVACMICRFNVEQPQAR